ncbi:TetR/AcrR family transcriptional regulator [Nocardia colli]|uniref:TetR/AcrR family transcriptional regulator n=1 Tax=Nocardia colli TaxID=2545717 RepID=UPI0035E076C1
MPRPAIATATQMLNSAGHLFYWQGVRATSVPEITALSGISPAGLYRLYDSKEDLFLAYVEHAADRSQEWFLVATSENNGSPRSRILALFDQALRRMRSVEGRGCPILLTMSEFPDSNSPAYRRAIAYKRWLRDQLGELTAELSDQVRIPHPEALADQLLLIIDGMYVSTQVFGPEGPPSQAKAIIERLIPKS